LLRKVIADQATASEDDFKRLDKEVRDIVNEAARFAQDAPEPEPTELWTDILVEA
jgi:pyruvate dehydrogenase E1 component alpha subunit